MDAAGPLDGKVLEELRELQRSTSPSFLAELIDLFFKQVDDLLPRLRQALETRDIDALVRISHTLKGTCGSVGALRLSGLCGRLNEAARRREWEAAAQLSGVEEEYRLVHAALEAEKGR